jgi:SAM-dependent methyltransferase
MSFLRKLVFNLRYFQKPPWDTGISPPELIQFIERNPPGKALDIGCGTGTNVITLAQRGWKVTGIDFASRAINRAKKKALKAGVDVDLLVDDITHPRILTGSYDLILDMGCFHSLTTDDTRGYIRNLVKLLSPGGTYLMYAFFKEQSQGGTGLVYADLEALSDNFLLVHREDGTERGKRPSAWFTYQHK